MNKNILWGVVVLIIVVVGGVFYSNKNSEASSSEKKVVKIGLIAPLTGSVAFIGEAGKNGAELAMDKINSDKNLKYKYELVTEDDSFDPKKTIGAVNKLISIDKVNAVISVGSGPGNVVSPVTENAKVPHLGMASDVKVAKGDYNFIHWTQPGEEVDLLLQELVKRNLKNVAVFTSNQEGDLACTKIFREKASAMGINIVDDQIFNPGDKDFRTMISNSKKKNPDIYLLEAFSPEIEILAKQMKDLGISKPLTSIESIGLSSSQSTFEGQWFIGSALSTSGFDSEYKNKYGKDVGPTGANAYDAINLIVRAVEKSGNASNENIMKQLSQSNDYVGALGALKVSPEGVFLSKGSVKIIKDGKAVPVE